MLTNNEVKSKQKALMANILLLIWFSLGMLGFSIGNFVLVQTAWMEIDGLWNLIFLAFLALFWKKEKWGKALLTGFLAIWLIAQFSVHWRYTIFGATTERIASYYKFYSDTFFIISSETRIIPDLWHIVLHTFILMAFVFMIRHHVRTKKNI